MTTDREDPTRQALLRARARQLARPPEAPATGEMLDLLEFGLAGERYAFVAGDVDDVAPLRELTPLPCAPPFLRGLVNIRGRLVAVVDLKRFFGLPDPGITDLHRVLLLRKGGMEIGVLADTVEGVQAVPATRVHAPLPAPAGIRVEYIRGVTPERMVVLDADAILDDPRLIIDEEVDA